MKRTKGGGSAGRVPGDAASGETATSDAPANVVPSSDTGVEGAGGSAEQGTGFAPDSYASAGLADGGAELLEDRSLHLGASSTGRARGNGRTRRTWMSANGALVGTFLVAALALGAAAGPLGLTGGFGNDRAADGGDTTESTPTHATDGSTDGSGEPDGADGPAATDHPDGADAPDATETPVDGSGDGSQEPTTTEPPVDGAPESKTIEIGVGLDSIYPVIEWSRCSTDGFVAYKIVRSSDEQVTWPLGAGDSVVGVLSEVTAGRFVDRSAKAGKTYHYRVIALRTWNGETAVACRSLAKGVTTPVPDPTTGPVDGLGLTLSLTDGGHPVIDWTACTGVDFNYYKVVRSKDATVTWPAGENDALVAVVGPDGDTITTDTGAPAGTTVYYRVFCVRATDAGYVTLASSDVRSIKTPAAEPAPDPVALGFEVSVGGEGVALSWQPCTSDAFHWYKIVRSTTTTNPSYLPSTDGTELIGVIENATNTHFVDGTAPSGATVYYRVQCLGYWNGKVILLGETTVRAVAIP